MLTPSSRRADGRQLSRRAALATGVALVSATAGCTDLFDDEDETDGSDEDIAAAAPAETTVLSHLDVTAIDDETAVQTLEELAIADPGTLVAATASFEARTGLDPLEATELLVVDEETETDEAPSRNDVILDSDWDEETVVDSLEETTGVEYEQSTTEAEAVLYRPTEAPDDNADTSDDEADVLGVLGEGRFIVGSEGAVESSLEVQYGDADPVSGPVRDAYDDARGGQVTVASVPSRSLLPVDRLTEIPLINGDIFGEIEAVGQRGAVDDAGITLEFACHVDGESDAAELEGVLDSLLLILLDSEGAGNLPGIDLEGVDLEAIEADDIDLEREGSIVELAYEGAVETIVALLDGV